MQKLNPGIENGLPIDYVLIIKKGTDSATKTEPLTLPEDVVDVKNIPAGNLSKAQFLIEKASENLGSRYRSGGTTSAGFDCFRIGI